MLVLMSFFPSLTLSFLDLWWYVVGFVWMISVVWVEPVEEVVEGFLLTYIKFW